MDKEKLIAIVSKLERKDGRLDGNKTKEIEKYLTKEEIALIDKSIDAKSLIEKVFLVSKRLWEVPICPTCGKKLRFTGKYRKFCSVRCAKLNKDFTDNQIKKSIEKYGTRWPSQSSEVKEKIKSTCLNRYGVTTTLIEKKTKEKIKETWIDKHGVDNPWKNAKVQEKRKQTWIDKYGVDNPLKDDDVKRTHQESCLKKYGVKHIGECELIRQKIKKTMLEKHGVASFLEIPWVIEKSHNKETIAKSNVTKRKNHTFNTSKSEEKTFEILKERYPDVIRQ